MQTKLAEQTVNIPPVITAKFGKDEEWEKITGVVRNITPKDDIVFGNVYYQGIALMVKRNLGEVEWVAFNITTKQNVQRYAGIKARKSGKRKTR